MSPTPAFLHDPTPDHPALAALLTAAHPDTPRRVEERRLDERHAQDALRVRWVWDTPGAPPALAGLFEDHTHPGWFRLRLTLHPGHDRLTCGKACVPAPRRRSACPAWAA